MKKRTYRLIFFNHGYLTSIRHGIQAGHAAVELMVKYPKDTQVQLWAKKHKTFIILNAGVTSDLNKIKKLIPKNLPFATFREPDCGNMITSIAVLVPNDYWERQIGEDKDKKSLARKLKFVRLMNESRLAK